MGPVWIGALEVPSLPKARSRFSVAFSRLVARASILHGPEWVPAPSLVARLRSKRLTVTLQVLPKRNTWLAKDFSAANSRPSSI